MGIRIHAWVTVSLREGDLYPEFAPAGTPERAFDVHDPAFRAFVVALLADLVRRYDVDGVNLDYIRSIGICRSDRCRSAYQRRFGTDLLEDERLAATRPDARARLREWQDGAVREIVSAVSAVVREARPQALLSVDSVSEPDAQARDLQGRDDIGWANRGLVDRLFYMAYAPKFDLAKLREVRSALAAPDKLSITIANYDLVDGRAIPRSGAAVARVMSALETHWPRSETALYLLNQLTESQSEHLSAVDPSSHATR
jgi:hypothetical protein